MNKRKVQKALGKEIKVTAQGSLGLLALGDLGVLAWKKEIAKQHKRHHEEEE